MLLQHIWLGDMNVTVLSAIRRKGDSWGFMHFRINLLVKKMGFGLETWQILQKGVLTKEVSEYPVGNALPVQSTEAQVCFTIKN